MNIYKSQEEIYNLLVPELFKIGFTQSTYEPEFSFITFKNESEQSIEYIRINFYNDDLGLNELQGYIILKDVNKILEKFIGLLDDLEIVNLKDYTNSDSNLKKVRGLYQKHMNKEAYAGAILNHIRTCIVPFFTKYPDMETINEEILNKVPESEYKKYIHGEKNFKVLIIMKLCNNPNYQNFKLWAEETYKNAIKLDPDRYGQDFDNLKSLIIYLDSGKYKEVLENKNEII